METILKVGSAISALRGRTQDKTFGSRVDAGKFQLVKTVYGAKGKSQVTELSTWMPAAEFIAFVNAQ